MRFAMFKGEKSVTDLANRLFRIQGRGSQAATKQAADALLKSNPQLSDVSKVPVGSLIAIPDAAPPVSPNELAIAPGLVRSFALDQAQGALDSLHQRLGEIETMAAEKVKSAMGRLQVPEVKAALKTAAGQDPSLADRLPTIDSAAKDIKQMLKDVQTAQNARKQAVTQLQTALTSFAKK